MFSNHQNGKRQGSPRVEEESKHSTESMQLFELTSSLWKLPTLHESIQNFLQRVTPIYALDLALIFVTPEGQDPQLYAEVGLGQENHHHIQFPALLLEDILAAPQQALHQYAEFETSSSASESDDVLLLTSPILSPQRSREAKKTPAPLSSSLQSSRASSSAQPKSANVHPAPAPQRVDSLTSLLDSLPRTFESVLAIAMRVSDSLEGVLVLARQQPQHKFTPEEISMLCYMSQQVALAMTYRRRLATTQQTERELRDTQRLHHLILEATQEGVWGWDLPQKRLYLSANWKKIIGYKSSEEDLETHPDEWLDRIHPEDRPTMIQKIRDHINQQTPHFEDEHRLQCIDGNYRWVQCRGIADRQNNQVSRIVGTLRDIHDQKVERHKLEYHALHDPLTNLPNRALLLDRLNQSIKKRQRQKQSHFAVLFLDLNGFKKVNDNFGHHVGDQLLRSMSHRLRSCLRTGDTLSRLGGDEFVILLENLDNIQSASKVAQRIQSTVKQPFLFQNQEVCVSTSIGIAACSDQYSSPEELIQNADAAMYHAKVNHPEMHCFFEDITNSQGSSRLQLKKDLHLAILNEQFRLEYQPIVSLDTGDVKGLEAYLRWQHPTHGLLAPKEFLPTCEETGLIVPLSWWILNTACRQMKQWQTQFKCIPTLDLHINLSSHALLHPEFLEQLGRCLRETDLAPFSLHLEIKEETLISNTSKLQNLSEKINEYNVHFNLDDFGTGFSSISYLHQFPLHTIKIDQSFLRSLGQDSVTNNIVRTICVIAHDLGIDLIAEGVENQEQVEILKQLRCPHAQGFLFAEPMTTAQVEKYLQQHIV